MSAVSDCTEPGCMDKPMIVSGPKHALYVLYSSEATESVRMVASHERHKGDGRRKW